MIRQIQAIDAKDIPPDLIDACLEIDDEFPLHYATGLVSIHKEDDGNPFVEWLKSEGFKFSQEENWTWLGVWGT